MPLLACGLAIAAASGCQKRTVQAAPPVVIAPAPTETQPPPTPPSETKTEPAPEPAPPAPVAPPVNPTPKPTPHKTPPTPKENSEPATKPAAPQISPQLTPGDQVAYEQKTNEDIAAAEKNLQKAYGRELSAAQHDLVEKIRGFIGQAHEAARESDWVRARNLAQKANVLSVELANSL